jgi:hypothetical protein
MKFDDINVALRVIAFETAQQNVENVLLSDDIAREISYRDFAFENWVEAMEHERNLYSAHNFDNA